MIFHSCIFKKVSGFTMAHQSSLYFWDCKIYQCTSTLQLKGFFDISNSGVQLINSEITDNNILETGTLIFLRLESILTMRNMTFTKNVIMTHLMAEGNSTIIMMNCKFVNNTSKRNPYTVKGIVVANETYLELTQCDFSRNILEGSHTHLMIIF